jgi:putative transposase
MSLGRPIPAMVLSPEMREQLHTMSRACSLPQALAMRARLILLAADGLSHTQIAVQLRLSLSTVGKWRRRYLHQGVAGLYDEAKPGVPRSTSDEQVAGLIRKPLKTKPKDRTHWTCRAMSAEAPSAALKI